VKPSNAKGAAMSTRNYLLLLLAATLCAGCFHIEESITLREDGSGTVHMMVSFPQPGMRWLPGKPSIEWLRPNLPDGVRLTSFANKQKQTTVTDKDGKDHELIMEEYEFGLAFDEIEALNDIRIRPDTKNAMAAAAGGTPGKETAANMAPHENVSPKIGPFQTLTLKEDGDLLHFRRVVQAAKNPDDIDANMMSAPGSASQPQAFDLGDSMLKISITCPGNVVKHNAQRVKGNTLIWEFKLKELQENQDRDWIVSFTTRREQGK
jgi:hypothetical protein